MAKLLDTEYPFPQHEDFPKGDWRSYIEASKKALNEIPADKLISFGVADGYAYYYVVSLTPLVLQHVPFLDAYSIPGAHIRGLRKEDVLQNLKSMAWLKEIFPGESI